MWRTPGFSGVSWRRVARHAEVGARGAVLGRPEPGLDLSVTHRITDHLRCTAELNAGKKQQQQQQQRAAGFVVMVVVNGPDNVGRVGV